MPETMEGVAKSKSARLMALDIFRGLTITTMIIVNDPGLEEHTYAPLQHARWNGITPTDYVFPSFIFMVGISVALSYSKQLAKGLPRRDMLRKIFRRAIILFVLGVFLSTLPYFDFANYRIPGVLQRISLVYVACALLFLYTGWKFQARLSAFILLAYCLVMTLVPVPGYGYAILEPGKNLAAWLDAIVIPGRMWQGTWDPEGILSSFPAVVSGILGMLTGQLVLGKQTTERKIIWLFFGGFISFAVANMWNWWFPINKNLWTSSFVLYTAGLDAMILASLYYLVDVLGYQRGWKFAMIYGSNAIAAYLVAEVVDDLLVLRWSGREHGKSMQEWAIERLLTTGISPELLSFLWALAFCALCFIPIYFLYRKKIFLKI
ncbi:MAG: heparan-alpha-glucosaminide N-acetyltransferase domain-containing protein [Bacteroidota bacterium]|nr:heparan-alpha-glucosaminide N-acetyltransferase domain-containing protein [Bacteroidota bacterium]MDP4250282.1 heparan-alpha-glucosaminide N-acetyltransferase domain-containing protein [Bacteroidota bacterium]